MKKSFNTYSDSLIDYLHRQVAVYWERPGMSNNYDFFVENVDNPIWEMRMELSAQLEIEHYKKLLDTGLL